MFGNKVSYMLSLAALILCVVAGFVTVYILKRDVDEDDGKPVTDGDILKEFERAYYSGEMDEDEFRLVKAKLEGKPLPAPPPPPQPAPSQFDETNPTPPTPVEG